MQIERNGLVCIKAKVWKLRGVRREMEKGPAPKPKKNEKWNFCVKSGYV
jgi:hypothetical protein